MRRGGRTNLPQDVADQVTGKVLAAAQVRGGGWLVLSTSGLVLAGHPDSADQQRPWHVVDRGEWSSDGNRIQVTWVDGQAPIDVELTRDDREIAAVLREQVEHTLVHAEVERLPGGGMLRGTIRRDSDGTLFSQVSIVGKVRRDEALAVRVRAMESRVRSQVGLPA